MIFLIRNLDRRLRWLAVGLVFSICSTDAYALTAPDSLRVPLKVKGDWPEYPLTAGQKEIVFEDTIGVTHRIRMLLRQDGTPEGYVSRIETPVCTDTLCALADISMFWTLAGTYWAFDTIPTKPLTKNDHIKFNTKDYDKLHELLQDEQSILRRRHKDDLFDKEVKRVSQVVDAVTGATAREVKEAVVEGAVYTSFTLYHLVHSQLAAVIREDAKKNVLPVLKEKLLHSPKTDERIFYIRESPEEHLRENIGPIVETIPVAVPRDRLYIMKKLPVDLWEKEEVQVYIARKAAELDVHSLSFYLNQLKSAKTVHAGSLRYLSEVLDGFSVNQLRTYLALLEKAPGLLKDSAVLANIRKTAANPGYQYSSYLKSFLSKQGIELQ